MLRPRHVPLVLRAIARWAFGSRTVRRSFAVVAAILVGWGLLSDGETLGTRSGKWVGFHNNYAPDEGVITITSSVGRSATCSVRGRAGSASGNGWVFRGDARIDSTSCEGTLGRAGKVNAALALRMEWSGRVKGIGGDWENVSGSATCEGELVGTLAEGGEWKGLCKREERQWQASFDWKLTGG